MWEIDYHEIDGCEVRGETPIEGRDVETRWKIDNPPLCRSFPRVGLELQARLQGGASLEGKAVRTLILKRDCGAAKVKCTKDRRSTRRTWRVKTSLVAPSRFTAVEMNIYIKPVALLLSPVYVS